LRFGNVRVTVTTLLPKTGVQSMRGVRTLEVSSDGNAGTALHVREEYTGPLLGLIWRSTDLGPSFGRFAQGVKRRAETGR
jgi:hypothetical protein